MVLQDRIQQGEQFRQSEKLHDQHISGRDQLSLVAAPARFNPASYVAVLGFAEEVGWGNRSLAYHAGRAIVDSGHIVLCGNTTSTFESALRGANQAGGWSQVIIERDSKNTVPDYQACYRVKDAATKHRLLINHSRAAVVIGGGPRTLKLVQQLVSLDRIVVAIEGTGGVVRRELPSNVIRAENAATAVAFVSERLAKGWRAVLERMANRC